MAWLGCVWCKYSTKGILEWWVVWVQGLDLVNDIQDRWPGLNIVISLGNRWNHKGGIM
jgi:hypothetical protein